MGERRGFQDTQYKFAAHIRDPENCLAPPGIEDRRMAIYRDLFFNNLRNLLATFFPVMRKIHTDDRWQHLIREFMKIHRAKTPYFLQLPEEFLAFLQDEYSPLDDDYPFLNELAHYEYADLALRVAVDENDTTGIDPDGDLLSNVPVKSVLSQAYAYQYPVHRIDARFLPMAASEEPTFLAICRQSDDKVRFMELNAVTAALLDAVEDNEHGLSGAAMLRELANTINYPDVDALIRHGGEVLKEMRQLEILTGTRRAG